MNGSAAIHDYEIARFGGTSEDVAAGLRDGTFGMAEETGRGMNEAFIRGMKEEWGMGESLGARPRERGRSRTRSSPSCSTRAPLGVPCTVHAALGAEIIHQHPAANGAAIGDTSHRDFRRLAGSLPDLHDGGVVLNLGSAVIMPEVFLKALTIARNLHAGRPANFTTVRSRHEAPLPAAHERRAAPDAGQRAWLRDHGAPRTHGAVARVGGGGAVARAGAEAQDEPRRRRRDHAPDDTSP